MKPSSTSLFKNLASSIHPQVVLSKTESKHLLNALTASFRHQLDVEHPHSHASVSNNGPSGPLTLTEKHVASVLTNPLFVQTRPGSALTGTPAARHPIEIFETCVANGTASLTTAMQCLSAFQRSLRKESSDAKRRIIAHHRPGTKVLQWLWANNLTQSEVFTFDPKLYKAVVVYLIRERREEIVRNWTDAASEDSSITGTNQSPKSLLLNWLITCKVKSHRDNLSPALGTFLEYVRTGQANKFDFAHLAGSQLVTLLSLQNSTSELDRKLVIEFLDSSTAWQRSDSDPVAIDMACLKLRYAPFKSIDDALQLAKRLDLQQTRSEASEFEEKLVRFLVSLSDAIQRVGSQAQATKFITLLQKAEKNEKTPLESLLSRATRGIPSLLLQEFEKLDFSPRQIAVPG